MVSMPHWPVPLWHKEIDLGLTRIRSLLDALGNPEKSLPKVIHIAGTNGKGSTNAFMRAILEAAGFKVHSYTSPHLMRFNERINLAGKEISDSYLYEIMEETRLAAEEIKVEVTFFEGTTAAAFLAFSREEADFLLLETGMGGWLDATNVIDNPFMTIITPISFDHMQYLGDSLAKIAYEKAGIIKPNVPCISSLQAEEAFSVIDQRAEELGAPLSAYEYDFVYEEREDGVHFLSKEEDILLPKLALAGRHQYLNAATCIYASMLLKDYGVTKDHIIQGLKEAKWPGRLQKLTSGAIYEKLIGSEIWLDGAHNQAGSAYIADWANEYKGDKKLILVFGLTKGRNVEQFLEAFSGVADQIFGITVANEPSSYKGEHIASIANDLGYSVLGGGSLDEALDTISAGNIGNAIVLITGSLFLVGEALIKNNNLKLEMLSN